MIKMILVFMIGYFIGFAIHALCVVAKENK